MGMFEFLCMPFGLCNAPATFQRLMQNCLGELNLTYALIYLDNVCTVSLSLFADPERILRRFYVFAEEPCKSTITTSEPCSPVFKEAQPRPSEHSKYNISHTNILNLYLHVFLLLVIYCSNKASNRIVPKQKGFSVLLLDTPLTRSE